MGSPSQGDCGREEDCGGIEMNRQFHTSSESDWRNEEDYLYTENLSWDGWAWEFLRRNPKFREEAQNTDDRNTATLDMRKWGLTLLPVGVGRSDYESVVWRKDASLKDVVILGESSTPEFYRNQSLRPDVHFFGIDILQPIEKQIEQILILVEGLQKRLGVDKPQGKAETKTRKGIWVRYLRALDAEASGAELGEIGEALHSNDADTPSEDKARETLRQARHMIEPERYLPILRLSPDPYNFISRSNSFKDLPPL